MVGRALAYPRTQRYLYQSRNHICTGFCVRKGSSQKFNARKHRGKNESKHQSTWTKSVHQKSKNPPPLTVKVKRDLGRSGEGEGCVVRCVNDKDNVNTSVQCVQMKRSVYINDAVCVKRVCEGTVFKLPTKHHRITGNMKDEK